MHHARRPRLRSLALAVSVALLAGSLGLGGAVAAAEDAQAPASSTTTDPVPTGPASTSSAPPGPAATPAATDAELTSPGSPQAGTDEPVPAEPVPAEPVPAEPVPDEPGALPEPGESLVGELVQAYHDPLPHQPGESGHDEHEHEHDEHDELLSWVREPSGEAVRVLTGDVSGLPVGATVEVTVGDPKPDEASAEGHSPAVEVLSAAVVAAPVGDQQSAAQAVAAVNHPVTVVMMQPAGVAKDSTTVAQVATAVNGPVRDFWELQSGGAVRVGVAATVDWFQGSATCARPTELWAEAAARAGWTYASGRHLLVYVPAGSPGCSYGLGEVRQNMSSGGQIYVQAAQTSVIAHELGHNFGLNHSSQLQCDRVVEGPLGSTCQVSPYQDYYDVMGVSWDRIGSLSVLQQDTLGVLPAEARVDLAAGDAARDVQLAPVSGTTGTRAVRLTAADGSVYWLELRTAGAQDAWLGTSANGGLQQGVLVRRANPGSGDSSLLLDPTPSAPSGWGTDVRTVLTPGSPVLLAGGAFTVTVLSQSTTGAVVRVTSARAPLGSLDQFSLSGARLTMSGWAMDPDAPTAPVPVQVHVDGRVTVVAADQDRPDIGAAFSGAGAAHGWSFGTMLAEGPHTVCAYAIDVARGPGNTALGCRSVRVVTRTPQGSLDAVSVTGSTITVRGWALDPDVPTTSVRVHVHVDGVATGVTADAARPDVGRAFPGAGDAHGFSWETVVGPGTHTVCGYAIDVDTPSRNTPLGCRTVGVRVALPTANWEALTASGPEVSVRGWAVDADQPTSPVRVHVHVDGRATAVSADVSRPDVGRAFAGAGDRHGFALTTTVSPGTHTVCVYAIDVDSPSRNTALGCRAVTTQMALPRANWEELSASGSTLSLRGWAFDPDAPTRPVGVHVYVDGGGTALRADGDRADLAVAFPAAGAAHGFSHQVTVRPGTHTVCVYAIDVDLPARNTALGCRSIVVGMTLPRANWDDLSASGGKLSVRGWAVDPDDLPATVQVHAYVDGGGRALPADGRRPDVAAAFAGAGESHGFEYSVSAAPGTHVVCLYAIDVGMPWRNTALGCRQVLVPAMSPAEAIQAA